MKKNILILSSILLIIIIIAGCAPTKPVIEERVLSADRLIKRLEANRRKIKSFNGAGVISVSSNQINARSTFQVTLKKPDSLKISFYGPFGIDLAHSLITPTNFQFYDVINNTLYRGHMRDGIIERVLKVNFSFDELIDALAGSVNLTEKLRVEPDRFSNTTNTYILTYLDSENDIEKIYNIRSDDFAIIENILKKTDGKVLVEGKYSKFKNYEDVPVPHEITLNDIANKQNLKVEYRQIVVNKNTGSLKLDIPSDVNVIEW